MKAILSLLLAGALFAPAFAADGPDVGAHGPSQAAADLLRQYAGTDGAFLAAGLVKDSYQKDRLETLLQYPTDEVVVLNLTGDRIRQAFERSISLYPQPNASFLQIAGFEVKFNKSAPPNHRVVEVTANGSPLQDAKSYTVAMPSSLGKGGLGYFKIWDKSNLGKSLGKVSIEDVLRGKAATDTPPRWIAQS